MYSENELKLFRACGLSQQVIDNLGPDVIYRMAIEHVFLEKQSGPHVATLRLVYKAWNQDQVYRMTPEFEALFDVKEPATIDFWLDAEQTKKYEEWYEQNKPGYCGAIGGAMQFMFAPTSLGIVCTARNSMTGAKIDLTDYDSW